MKLGRRVCEIKIEAGAPRTFHTDIDLEVLVDDVSTLTASKDSVDEVVEHVMSKNASEAVEKISKELKTKIKLWEELEDVADTQDLTKFNILIIAKIARVHVKVLNKNFDLLMPGEALQRVGGAFVSEMIRIARVAPSDIRAYMVRLGLPKELRELNLKHALSGSADSPHTIDTGWAEQVLGHKVTTDPDGLALDFNPGGDSLDDYARRQLVDEGEIDGSLSESATNDIVDRRKAELQENVNEYLFGQSGQSGASEIIMTGSRMYDERAAVRSLIRKNNGSWFGLGTSATDSQVQAAINELKKMNYVFHHSGKVWYNEKGVLVTEMQLISKDAHYKIAEMEHISKAEVDGWWDLNFDTDVEVSSRFAQMLKHVGACKVFTVYFGLKNRYM